jgi:hypothetical protein
VVRNLPPSFVSFVSFVSGGVELASQVLQVHRPQPTRGSGIAGAPWLMWRMCARVSLCACVCMECDIMCVDAWRVYTVQ